MDELPPHQQTFLLFHSQHVQAQTGHHHVIHEKYANDDAIPIRLQCWCKFENLLVKVGWIQLNIIDTLNFKVRNKHTHIK
jgi:hypothetical protein